MTSTADGVLYNFVLLTLLDLLYTSFIPPETCSIFSNLVTISEGKLLTVSVVALPLPPSYAVPVTSPKAIVSDITVYLVPDQR